jgi:hypothetical protein
MQKIIIIILLFSYNFGFSQSEQDNYEIYSLVLNDKLENWFENHFQKVVLITKYENRFDDLELVEEYAADSLADYQRNMLYIYSSTRELTLELVMNKNLRKLLSDLEMDIKRPTKIKTELLSIGEVELDTLSMQKYLSYFGKNFKQIDNGWKKIENKFGTRLVMELSKIKYMENYATLYYGHHCGGLCGAGRLIIMEKKDGKWTILGDLKLWDS